MKDGKWELTNEQIGLWIERAKTHTFRVCRGGLAADAVEREFVNALMKHI